MLALDFRTRRRRRLHFGQRRHASRARVRSSGPVELPSLSHRQLRRIGANQVERRRDRRAFCGGRRSRRLPALAARHGRRSRHGARQFGRNADARCGRGGSGERRTDRFYDSFFHDSFPPIFVSALAWRSSCGGVSIWK